MLTALQNLRPATTNDGSIPAKTRIPLKARTRSVGSTAYPKLEVAYNGVEYVAQATVGPDNTTVDTVVDLATSNVWFHCDGLQNFEACEDTCMVPGEACIIPSTFTFQAGDLKRPRFQSAVMKDGYGATLRNSVLATSKVKGVLGLGASDVVGSFLRPDKLLKMTDSFSLSLADAHSFVMLNGVDEALIADGKLTPATVAISESWALGMTAFQIDGVADAKQALFSCPYDLRTGGSQTSCKTALSLRQSCVTMPGYFFQPFEQEFLNKEATGCEQIAATEQLKASLFPSRPRTMYVCPSTIKLPRLAFTFGNTTLYLDGKDYVTPLELDPSKVLVELAPHYAEEESEECRSSEPCVSWTLGTKFLKQFFIDFHDAQNVTFFCAHGMNCDVGVASNPEPRGFVSSYAQDREYVRAYFQTRPSAPTISSPSSSDATASASTSADSVGSLGLALGLAGTVAMALLIGLFYGARDPGPSSSASPVTWSWPRQHTQPC